MQNERPWYSPPVAIGAGTSLFFEHGGAVSWRLNCAMPIAPLNFFHSLRRKLVFPLLLIGVAVAGLTTWQLQLSSRRQWSELALRRAELVAHMVNYTAESVSRAGELQRVVAAIGADEGILAIVVVGGQPVRVIASTRGVWRGKLLTDLPGEEVADDLNLAMQTRSSHQHFNEAEHRFHYSMPLLLSQAELTKGTLSAGAVTIYLDTRSLSASIRTITTAHTLIVLAGLCIITGIGFALLRLLVLQPVARISRAVLRDREGLSPDWNEVVTSDELGALAGTLRDAMSRTAFALHELENQKFALDQHAIVALTDVQGRITYANDRFCTISGYAREELLGQNHRLLRSEIHPPEFYTAMWRTIAQGRVWHGEIGNRAKDGHLYWVDSTLMPLLDAAGKPHAYIAIRTDISARKQTEVELQRAKADADADSRAKSEFLATMSHEIRTPMNGVIGFTDLLIETELSTKQRKYVEMLRTSGENLLVLINDILDFSKIEAGKLVLEEVPCEIRRCAREVLELLDRAASEKCLMLECEFAAAVPRWLTGDAVRLRQIILNLMGNALKFTAQGKIRLVGQMEPGADAPMLRISCTDTGIGIPLDKQAQLFQKFTQADASTTRRFGGTGLGLAICKRLVEAMGGQIGVSSEAGQGSTFWFTLPVRVPEQIPADPDDRLTPPPAPAVGVEPLDARETTGEVAAPGPCVLVVDDSDINLLLATSFAQSLGYTTEVAENGRIAVELAAKKTYRLILMDYHMPVLDGCQATSEIRQGDGPNRQTLIVGLSASLEDREHCLQMGMNDFLSKPLRKAELKEILMGVRSTKPGETPS